jgi:hypothetical protein
MHSALLSVCLEHRLYIDTASLASSGYYVRSLFYLTKIVWHLSRRPSARVDRHFVRYV